ncbi:MAG: DUF1653 domain-containing protein [Geobacteraceae bacterium]|nr:DUF1653 domain-containing protein [Geobacteraceae bacterium]
MINKEPSPGRYRHYKGGEYEVIGTARHSENDEMLVVYRCLYDNNSLWVRPLAMFMDSVETATGLVQRFTHCESLKPGEI